MYKAMLEINQGQHLYHNQRNYLGFGELLGIGDWLSWSLVSPLLSCSLPRHLFGFSGRLSRRDSGGGTSIRVSPRVAIRDLNDELGEGFSNQIAWIIKTLKRDVIGCHGYSSLLSSLAQHPYQLSVSSVRQGMCL
jgi:hypothetical protein